MAAAITLNKTEVSRITNLWKSADPFGSDNSNKSKYEAKIAECEKRISKFETEIQEVAKEGLGLLELLGITESHSSPYGVSKLDGRRWLDLSNQSSDAEVKP